MMFFTLQKVRKDFPLLQTDAIYFDNACMSLKPQQVIDKIIEYYTQYPACTGRSAHRLASRLGEEVESSRIKIQKFIHAQSSREILFTRNTTEGINLVANSIHPMDHVIISDKEHNSNLIPWLHKKVKLSVVKSNTDNTFNLENFEAAFTKSTRLVSIVWTSNLDGVTNPIKEIAKITHEHGALLLVDGAQYVPGKETNVKSTDMDFLSFSGHKMLGPTGTGILYGKKELLETMPQFIVGGETVIDSTYNSFVKEEVPMKFEAGLQDYAGIVGLGAAVSYLQSIGMDTIQKQDTLLNKELTQLLENQKKLSIIGPRDATLRSGIFSFTLASLDEHHVAKMLDVSKKIMVRSGRHCVHSWFNHHGISGSVRASMYFYNTKEEIACLAEQIKKIADFS